MNRPQEQRRPSSKPILQCPLCLEDIRTSEADENFQWPSKVALEHHMQSDFHSKKSRWLLEQRTGHVPGERWYCMEECDHNFGSRDELLAHFVEFQDEQGSAHEDWRVRAGVYDDDWEVGGDLNEEDDVSEDKKGEEDEEDEDEEENDDDEDHDDAVEERLWPTEEQIAATKALGVTWHKPLQRRIRIPTDPPGIMRGGMRLDPKYQWPSKRILEHRANGPMPFPDRPGVHRGNDPKKAFSLHPELRPLVRRGDGSPW